MGNSYVFSAGGIASLKSLISESLPQDVAGPILKKLDGLDSLGAANFLQTLSGSKPSDVKEGADPTAAAAAAQPRDEGKQDPSIADPSNTETQITREHLRIIFFIADLLLVSMEDEAFSRAILQDTNFKSLKDVATCCTELSDTHFKSDEAKASFLVKIFQEEPTCCFQGLLSKGQIKGDIDKDVQQAAARVLSISPNFNIRTDPVTSLLATPSEKAALQDVTEEKVIFALKLLQRLQSMAGTLAEIDALLDAGYTSAFQIANENQTHFTNFMNAHGLCERDASAIYEAASMIRARNEHAVMSMFDSRLVTGLAAIDGPADKGKPVPQKPKINMDEIFGESIAVTCDDCNSVTSPAAYLVDLFSFLKESILPANNNTVLDELFTRRPDLPGIELSCANTSVALPYIDLTNEILEACVISRARSPQEPLLLTAYNLSASDQSRDLILQPDNVNFAAYSALEELFSAFLPFDLLIESVRLFMKAVGTSRAEIIDTFCDPSRSPFHLDSSTGSEEKHTPSQVEAISRSLAAEELGLLEKEYCAVTSERFWPRDASFDAESNTQSYNSTIPLPHQLWGFPTEGDMDSAQNESQFVTNTLLKRAGIKYDDLILVLKTDFVNPVRSQMNDVDVDFFEHLQPSMDNIISGMSLSTVEGAELESAVANEILEKNLAGHFFEDRQFSADDSRAFTTRWLEKYYRQLDQTIALGIDSKSSYGPSVAETTIILGTGARLTPLHWKKIWCILRLWCSMETWTFDQISSALDICGELDANSLPTPKTLEHLSSLKKITAMFPVDVKAVFELWISFNNTGSQSRYEEIFLRPSLLRAAGPDYIFKRDQMGNVLSRKAKLSDYFPDIAFAFGASPEEIATLAKTSAFSDDDLDLRKLAKLYQLHRLSKLLNIKVSTLPIFLDAFRTPTTTSLQTPTIAFHTFSRWKQFREYGLKIEQLGFILQQNEFSVSFGPTISQTVVLAGKLMSSQLDILQRFPDILNESDATNELVSKVSSILFGSNTVAALIAFLNGTYIYTDEPLPARLLDHLPTLDTSGKLQYYNKSDGALCLRIIGILSPEEEQIALKASDDSFWSTCVNDAKIKAKSFMTEISVVLNSSSDSKLGSILLSQDFAGDDTTAGSAQTKRMTYLKCYIPQLRKYLQDQETVEILRNTITHLDPALVKYFLGHCSTSGLTVLDSLSAIFNDPVVKDQASGELSSMYFMAPANETYKFAIIDSIANAELYFDGVRVSFSGDGPINNPFDEFPLKQGNIYRIDTKNITPSQVQCGSKRSPLAPISSSALFPVSVVDSILLPSLRTLSRVSIIASTFTLSFDEVTYLDRILSKFSNMDSNGQGLANISITGMEYILDYCDLCACLPHSPDVPNPLLSFDKWIMDPNRQGALESTIATLFSWPLIAVETLLGIRFKGVDNDHKSDCFKDGNGLVELLRLFKQISVIRSIGVLDSSTSILRLFDWAEPIPFKPLVWGNLTVEDKPSYKMQAADALRVLALSKLDKAVFQRINDQLREKRRDAMISYLLQVPLFQQKGISDADGLFEYLLIDVQMNSYLLTSRIGQAISTVQLFVQRCLMGLERENGIPTIAVDTKRWESIEKYVLWEASRQVFLYPENWLDPTLRFGKTELFNSFEANISSKNLNRNVIHEAIRSYVTSLGAIANLEIVALHWEPAGPSWNHDPKDLQFKKIHLFARTRNAPFIFYYRSCDWSGTGFFTPWQTMNVDIPIYECDQSGGALADPGAYIVPYCKADRLFVFLPHFTQRTMDMEFDKGKKFTDFADQDVTSSKAKKYWEIKFAVSEYAGGKWTPKTFSGPTVIDDGNCLGKNFPWEDNQAWRTAHTPTVFVGFVRLPEIFSHIGCSSVLLPDIRKYRFWPCSGTDDQEIIINITRHSPCSAKYGFPADADVLHRIPVARVTVLNGSIQPKIQLDWAETLDKTKCNTSLEVLESSFSKVTRVPNISFVKEDLVKTGDMVQRIRRQIPVPLDAAPVQLKMIPIENPGTESFQDDPEFTHTQRCFNVEELQTQSWGPTTSLRAQPDVVVGSSYSFYNSLQLLHTLTPSFLSALGKETGIDLIYKGLETSGEFTWPYIEWNWKRDDSKRPLQTLEPALLDARLIFGFGLRELKAPYSQYNTELGLHIPMLLVDKLFNNQQFELALQICRLVFDPFADGEDVQRCWRWPPFRHLSIDEVHNMTLDSLGSGKGLDQTILSSILDWKSDPFSPYTVARSRPTAYMKWIVMKYIEILIAYGDYYFRQDSLEAVPVALQYYVQASKVFGPRVQTVPDLGRREIQTYASLQKLGLDNFSNALVDMEVQFPFIVRQNSSSRTVTVPSTTDTVKVNSVYQHAMSKYFCISQNPKLKNLQDLIDDRLFKIRHCQNINGKTRMLPLFDALVSPTDINRSKSTGDNFDSVMNELNSPMPNYRFYFLLQKALELCNELKNMASLFLSAKEKGDAERFSLLRAQQESMIHATVLEIKNLQLEEASKSLDALHESRRGPELRLDYYLKLTGEDNTKIPIGAGDYQEIDLCIEAPSKDDLRLTVNERIEMQMADIAGEFSASASTMELFASVISNIPDIEENMMPLGGGVTIKAGTEMIAQSTRSLAQYYRILSEFSSLKGSKAARKSQMTRQLQDRRLQANIAGREIKLIDKQIEVQQIRINTAKKEINVQEKQVENSAKTEEFLKSKYTNAELYQYLENSARMTLYQTYTLAYDVAKRAEMAYRFERGIEDIEFIKFGYWDGNHDGLMAAEGLNVSLRKLETAYMDNRGHDYEITRHISLRAVSPVGLLQLRRQGFIEFCLPEILFDMDFPGHYRRRIKSVSVSIPCVVGPYTSMNCTLQLLQHRYRVSSSAKHSADYLERLNDNDERFKTNLVPITSIAVSSGQTDSGVFDLNFHDERYIPFEGAGVISRWRLELPTKFRQFDYDTISDVILHLRYTSCDGGRVLKDAAAGSVDNFLNQPSQDGLVALFDLKNDFPTEWYRFSEAKSSTNPVSDREMQFGNLTERLPFFARSRSLIATQITLVTTQELGDVNVNGIVEQITLFPASDSTTNAKNPIARKVWLDDIVSGKLISYDFLGNGTATGNETLDICPWKLKISGKNEAMQKMWLMVKYYPQKK